jgi:hypothetical protein
MPHGRSVTANKSYLFLAEKSELWDSGREERIKDDGREVRKEIKAKQVNMV